MATLTHAASSCERALPERALIGRSSACDIRIPRREVSSEHAALRWIERRWVVVDLGSRNGTSIDGEALQPGSEATLERGSTLRFACEDEVWIFSDDGPPQMFARSKTTERQASHGILVLPDDDRPRVTIHRSPAGVWIADDGEGTLELEDRQELELDGTRWRLHLPGFAAETWDLAGPVRSVGLASLSLSCSRDEEKICARLDWGQDNLELGYRAHHAVLLQLLRARLDDDAAGLDPADRGWIYRQDLARELGVDVAHLNILIYRLRRQLATGGLVDGASIVECRGRSGELRLGALRRASFELRGQAHGA